MKRVPIDQASAAPTRKLLTGATVAAAGTEAWQEGATQVTLLATEPTTIAIAESLNGSLVSAMIGATLAVTVGWFVRDLA